MPQWSQIKATTIVDMWAQCVAWKVEIGEDTNPVYTYVHIGKDIKKELGINTKGRLNIDQFRHFPGARILQKMDRMVETPVTMVDEVNFITEQNQIIKCRTCMLPFGGKDGNVTHIVIAVSSRLFD